MNALLPSLVPQPVAARLSRAAIFLVVTLTPGGEAEQAAKAICAGLSGLLRAVGFRDLDGGLSCVLGIGSNAWDRLFTAPRPEDLHPCGTRSFGGWHRPSRAVLSCRCAAGISS